MAALKSEQRTSAGRSVLMNLAPVVPDSFRRTGFIERWRFWAPALLALGFAGWRITDAWLQTVPGTSWHSPGPLASAHVLYDHQCNACHTDFTPVSASSWLATTLGRTHSADAKCTECHESSKHHGNENPGRTPACASCHLDHRGRDTSLVRAPDRQCTSCHAELTRNLADNAKTDVLNVTHFDKENHPDFRVSQSSVTDPRRLKFNHMLHLTPGFRRTERAEQPAFTLRMVDPSYRTLYGSRDQPDAEVSLDCKSCHQLDSRDFAPPAQVFGEVPRNAVTPARPPGAIMLPIVYERHCQACHPLTFESLSGANVVWKTSVIAHRQQPRHIHRMLESFYLQRLQSNKPDVLQTPFPPLPGKRLLPEPRALTEVVRDRVQRAEQMLYLGKKSCGECHYTTQPTERMQLNGLQDLRIEPTAAPEVWFQKANFTHTPHRLLDCLVCHQEADSRQELLRPAVGEVLQRVLLPDIAVCSSCHSSSSPGGGARQDCVSCHRYHDGGNPLSGHGAAIRAGRNAGKRSIQQFIEVNGP